jgi:hypothetical protein
MIDTADHLFTVRSIKLNCDGALGSRGAWLLEEYTDRPGHFGHETLPMEYVMEISREGVKKALDNMVWDFKGMFEGKTFSYKSHTVPMLRIFKAKVKMAKIQTAEGEKTVPTGGVYPISDWINTDEIKW